MNRHATLNRFYRLVWNDRLATYVAVAETAKGRGKRAVRAAIELHEVEAGDVLHHPAAGGEDLAAAVDQPEPDQAVARGAGADAPRARHRALREPLHLQAPRQRPARAVA